MGLASFSSGRGSQLGQLRTRESQLRGEVEASTGGTPEPRGPGVLARLIDLISRPNFAVAGAAEEAFSPQGRGITAVPGRVISELLSGVGNIQGQKEGFGEVLRQAGVGTGGQLSNVLPGLFSSTGKGLPLQRGGLFDITPRGTLGLGLDIATDPLTFVGGGAVGRFSKSGIGAITRESADIRRAFIARAKRVTRQQASDIEQRSFQVGERLARQRVAKQAIADPTLLDKGGLKFAGRTVVGGKTLAKPFRLAADTSPGRWVLEKGRPVHEAIDRLFQRDPIRFRRIPGAVPEKQRAINRAAAGVHLMTEFSNDFRKGVPKDIRTFIHRHADDPKRFPLDKIPEQYKSWAERYRAWNQEIAAIETKRGLLPRVRANYGAHIWKNRPSQVDKVLQLHFPGVRRSVVTSLGRFAEERTFDTIEEGIQISRKLKAEGRISFELTPITDVSEVIRIRGGHHAHAIAGDDYIKRIRFKTGRKTEDAAREVFDDTMPGVRELLEKRLGKLRSDSEINLIVREMIEKGLTGASGVAKLSREGRASFVIGRLQQVRSIDELKGVLTKYKKVIDDLDGTVVSEIRTLADTKLVDNAISPWGEVYVTVPKEIKQLAGWEVPKPIGDDIVDFHKSIFNRKEVGKLLAAYDTLNNIFKVSVTALFPAFHFRNAYSNISQSFLDIGIQALNPKLHTDTIGIMLGREGTFTTQTGRRFTYTELGRLARDNGVLVEFAHLAELVGEEGLKTRRILAVPRAIGRGIENEARMQLFLGNLRRGLSVENAAIRVNKFLFDYNNISVFQREVLSRGIPFFRWTRKNITLQLESLIKRPGRLATQIKPFRERGPENDSLPFYLRGDLKVKVQSKNGKGAFLTGIDLPITDLDRFFTGDWKETFRQNLSQFSPLLKVIPELAVGADFFTGREFSGRIQSVGPVIDKAPKFLKEYLEFNKTTNADGSISYNMNPTKTYLIFKSYAISRFFTTAERISRKDPDIASWAVDVFTGLRFTEFDLSKAEERQLRGRIKQLEQTLINRGKRRRFERTFIPKGQQ